jgi:hypothetical protein
MRPRSNKTRSGIALGRGVEHVKDSSPRTLRQTDTAADGDPIDKKTPWVAPGTTVPQRPRWHLLI